MGRSSSSAAPRGPIYLDGHLKSFIEAMMARYGIVKWRPDFGDSPYSLYNQTL